MSLIPKPTDQAPHMFGRRPYRLVWRDQAFKTIDQYFKTHYLPNIEHGHKYTIVKVIILYVDK